LAKTFSIYRSSAGSGKTRTLAKEYLKLALRFKADYFRHILAVTFTNKASQEMKDRILFYLDQFARAERNELAEELKHELNLDDQTFLARCQETQSAILHGYSQFSISTIDAFFQKVIRAFTRESGLIGDYRLEVEQDGVLETVVDNLIDELGENKELTEWIVEFAKENLENERAWDVRYSLIEFAKEIFREEFKDIEDEVLLKTKEPDFFRNLLKDLRSKKFEFINFIKSRAQTALKIIAENNLTVDDFKYGGGPYNFFTKASKISTVKDFDEKEKGKRPEKEYQLDKNWPDKDTRSATLITKLASEKLIPIMNEILSFWSEQYTPSLSAEVALNNFYCFGLISDISRKLREYKDENNMMLLADAPKFLNGVIQDSDTPFIYEKVGSFYKNYLIDEFQDTSGMQWKNFQPLIVNSLDQGFHSLVVGDVKQAIYRWRGGDLSLLQQNIAEQLGDARTEIFELDKNFRSAEQLISFNNDVFESAAAIVALQNGTTLPSHAYKDVRQKINSKEGGVVKIQFITEPKEKQLDFSSGDQLDNLAPKWKDIALDLLPGYLEELQLKGVRLKNIAILVRKNDEGQRIAQHLLQYKTSDKAKDGCRYDVVSNESLRIDGAASVNLLLGAMRYLLNPDDSIARAQLGYEFARLHEPSRELPEVFAVSNQNIFENNLPSKFAREKPALKKLALIELTESLIEIFGIGNIKGELIYLQAFQDLVLEFYNRERNDLGSFLEWWDANKDKKSIQISGDVDAVQIVTIHKSKGLQFKYVIIPFCSWALDHDSWQAPNLWVKSDDKLFRDAGYLPVKYGKTLQDTCFAEYYDEERTKVYLDNLNLLYVAFTRAEHGMIVTAPSPDVKGSKDSVAGLLYQAISQHDELKNKWDELSLRFERGEIVNESDTKHTSLAESIALNTYHASSWRNKLVIRQGGANFFRDLHDEFRDRINYGLHIHSVLSKMKYADEVDETLDQIIREGLITTDERVILSAELKLLFEMPQVSDWFSKHWEVKTEVSILLPDGVESRIDRLLLHEKNAIVIDFKTGERKQKDVEQVIDYVNILRKMNYVSVQGFLLYLRNKEIVEVESMTKQKITRKKISKDQLSLGL
jgi:ATP-dependent helicase/nuclease subunit A